MKTWLKLTLIVMSVGGGFAGIVATCPIIWGDGEILINRFLGFFLFLLYSFVLVSGLLFIHRPQVTTPLKVALALQIPWLSMPGFIYYFASASNLYVRFGGMDSGGIGFNFNFYLGSACKINFGDEHWNLGINLFAVALLYLIEKAEKTDKNALAQVQSPSEVPAGT